MDNIAAKLNAVCSTMEKGITLSDIESMRKLVGCYDYVKHMAAEINAEQQKREGEMKNEPDQSVSAKD